MKKALIALAATAVLLTGFASSAMAQSRYDRDHAPAVYLEDGEPGAYLVQERRHHDRDRYDRDRHDRRDRFDRRDVTRMLERRGFRVRDVDFERGRYFVKASRRGNPLLVVVSRSGEILETRRVGKIRERDRRSGVSIQINPAY
ncbi:MAG: hypothetical protein ACREIP_11485 [Alphaproteobacteria bacterium]